MAAKGKLLQPSLALGRCRECGRPLRSLESLSAGIGPGCAAKKGLRKYKGVISWEKSSDGKMEQLEIPMD